MNANNQNAKNAGANEVGSVIDLMVSEMWNEVEQIKAGYARAKVVFDAWVGAMARRSGGKAKTTALKGTGRAVEKTLLKNRKASDLKDLLRATVEMPTPAAARELLTFIKGHRVFAKKMTPDGTQVDDWACPGLMDTLVGRRGGVHCVS